MGAGSLAVACLWLFLGQVPSDVFYTNQRNHRIDVNFKDARRAEIREVRLYASVDPERKDWNQVASISPDKDHFVFHAAADGSYWLRVAVVNLQGKQEPENIAAGPPDQKMVIDTQKPIIRSLQARRQGLDVAISWEIQEDNPDPSSFRLEYQPKDGANGQWTAIPANPSPLGQARCQPGYGQPLVVRLVMRDLAGNLSYAVAEVGAEAVTPASYNPAPNAPGTSQAASSATTLPSPSQDIAKEIPLPMPVPAAPASGNTLPLSPPVMPPAVVPPPIMADGVKLPVAVGAAGQDVVKSSLPSSPSPLGPVKVVPSTPERAPSQPVPAASSAGTPAPTPADMKVVASSKWTPPVAAKVPTPTAPPAPMPEAVSHNELKPPVAKGPTRQLPPLQYINQPEFMLEYEVSKIGPSGVGSVELYRTRDDGQTWEKYAYDAEIRGTEKGTHHQRLVKFMEGEPDGVYGFILVIKNRAKVGRNAPLPGDVPELRVELDTAAPVAELFEPTPDLQQGHLLLRWKALDKNLLPTPVCLEWSEKRGGPWQPIALNLRNAERYSWKLPESLPVEVFLRLRVRDLANNETVAVTPNPLPVDLHEPEGHLLKVSVPGNQ